MSDAAEKFKKALEQRKKQLVENSVSGNGFSGNSGFQEIPYSALDASEQQVFRFVGLPYMVREKSTDSKRIHIAMILGDNDKKFRCIGPDPKEQKDWILYRVMNKVLSRRWDKNLPSSTGQLGAYVYDYATLHPDLFNRVAKNNNAENTLERGWRFDPYILFNVIDRANYGWHKENKKLRVLSKKASEWKDAVFFEPGVPDALFNAIMDDIVALDGNTNWEDYDIAIKKMTESPWYKVFHGTDDAKKIDEKIKPLIVSTGLTEEEAGWERHDFDKLFSVTRYSRIKSNLGLFFQKVDKVFGTKYYDELVALVDKEEAEVATSIHDDRATNGDVPMEPTDDPVAEPPPVAPAPETRSTPAPAVRGAVEASDIDWEGLAEGKYYSKKYLGVPLMTPGEKALVKGVNPDGTFIWDPSAGDILEGAKSKFLSPACVHIDPLDGTVFGQATL